MTFAGLIGQNVRSRKLRTTVTALAVAIGVMAVLALGVLTASLERSATSFLKVGDADFSVAQKNGNILDGTIDERTLAEMGKVKGVGQIIGALIQTDRYDAGHPAVIEVGLAPKAQAPFGVVLLSGRTYTVNSPNEIMLGADLAQSLHKGVGDTLEMGGKDRKVVGIYRTNVSYGNSTMMFPLSTIQGETQLTGQVTLAFVKAAKGVSPDTLAKRFDKKFLRYTAIQTAADYGQADQTLKLIGVADTGGTILAAAIAISGVLNTTFLSFYERTREFGVLRAVGWTRRRIAALVLGEAAMIGLGGLLLGLVFGWGAINALQNLSEIGGYLQPVYGVGVFARALAFAFGVVLVGATYPAMRAAFLSPMEAIRHE